MTRATVRMTLGGVISLACSPHSCTSTRLADDKSANCQSLASCDCFFIVRVLFLDERSHSIEQKKESIWLHPNILSKYLRRLRYQFVYQGVVGTKLWSSQKIRVCRSSLPSQSPCNRGHKNKSAGRTA